MVSAIQRKGFTLIEIIAVVAVVALLAAVILPAVFTQILKGRVSRITSETEVLRKATLEYFGDVELWPLDPAGGVDNAINQLINNPVGVKTWKGPYLDSPPRRNPGGRYVDYYGGCLMLDDTDAGDGDDSNADRNANTIPLDRYVYFGDVPAKEANILDTMIDGESSPGLGTPLTGNVVQFSTPGPDPCSGKMRGGDWTSDPGNTPETLLFIFSEGT